MGYTSTLNLSDSLILMNVQIGTHSNIIVNFAMVAM